MTLQLKRKTTEEMTISIQVTKADGSVQTFKIDSSKPVSTFIEQLQAMLPNLKETEEIQLEHSETKEKCKQFFIQVLSVWDNNFWNKKTVKQSDSCVSF